MHPQSGGHRRIDVTLSGYFSGLHTVVLQDYEILAGYLNGQRIKLYYHDGTRVVINDEEIYFDTLGEPEQWKQRLGDYAFTGYYILKLDPSFRGIIAMSFSSPGGSFNFSQLPVLGIQKNRAKDSAHGREILPSGAAIGAAVNLQISGEICESNHADLIAQKALLENAVSQHGTLNYGDLSYACLVHGLTWQPTVPINYWPYTIDLTYFLAGLVSFSAEIGYSRITTDPIVHENSGCPAGPYVIVRYPSGQGQWVDYHFEAEGESIASIRSLMLNEVNALVYPGGVEMKGGRERHNIQSPRVSLDMQYFYPTPVLANLGPS